jgi:hypothetical protein
MAAIMPGCRSLQVTHPGRLLEPHRHFGDVAVRGVTGLDGTLDGAGGLGDFGDPIELGAQELTRGCGGGAPVRFVCHAHAHGSPAILGSCRRRRGLRLVGRA